jgi:hypothetical protein
MVTELLMGFDEQTLAYDLQRAHSADIWFIRARFFIWGVTSTVGGFLVGHALSTIGGIDLYSMAWNGFWEMWYGLW